MESGKKSVDEQKKELAKAYAKYLAENDLKPGDATFVEPENLGVKSEILDTEIAKPEAKARKKKKKKKVKPAKVYKEEGQKMIALEEAMAAPLTKIDGIADRMSDAFHKFCIDFVKATSNIFAAYKNSKRAIGIAVLAVCVLSAVMLVVFDRFTVYEYAYNGKVLGYVKEQEEVTNVLAVAGDQLNQVITDTDQEIEFVANDNISFKRVVSSGKDADDADTTVNKLAYMTDIEVAAKGIYDGNKLATIVKDQESAERLLAEVKAELSTPDEGMELISSEFRNSLDIRDINVLLTSVQSNAVARQQMTEGGDVRFYHLVEEGETLSSIARDFSVNKNSIYDENNKEQLEAVSRGDKICIHKTVDPVSVEMVETGKMKEIVPYETIKKKSKKYYIGDEVVEVKGVDGVQIFEGTLTKVGGKVVDRDTKSIEVLTEKVDKLILVGTTKRPKTAPTGTFKNPLTPGSYVVTSRPGWRWGRTHEGVDMGCGIGNPVYASDGGVITCSGGYGGYGNCIDIQHNDGWMSRYGHLNSMVVKVGDKVYQGQLIGYSGNSGRSTGPHLHFEIRKNGKFVDPDTKVKGGL
ncbi:MAG: M23 family metallopeptidase [Clostridiales bacterium]|nr:M23 family metallopeptidase [Candidatus Crickella equi]